MPPIHAVFVSNHGAEARHRDFTCNAGYATSIASDVVDWTRRKHPAVRDFVIVGLSLSGLAAAHIAVLHPHMFRAAVCQSASFWWERGRICELLPTASPLAPEFWLSVGDRETARCISHPPSGLRQELTQIEGCRLAGTALRRRGFLVTNREFQGGHDPACWREDLALALPWVWRNESSEREQKSGAPE